MRTFGFCLPAKSTSVPDTPDWSQTPAYERAFVENLIRTIDDMAVCRAMIWRTRSRAVATSSTVKFAAGRRCHRDRHCTSSH